MRLRRFWKRPWLNMRTHRKIVVIDGRIAFTGGINITDEEDERLRDDAYRDLHLRLEGDVVRELQLVFIEDWAYATGRSAAATLHHARATAPSGPIAGAGAGVRAGFRRGRRSTACTSPPSMPRSAGSGW